MPSTAGQANHLEQQAESVAKDARVVELVNEGRTLQQIADEFGVNKSVIWRRFHRALERIPQKAVDAYRTEQLARLAAARQSVMDVLNAHHVVVSNGHVVSEITGTDEDGKPVFGDPLTDSAPVLAAVDRLVKLDDQEAKLLGLYAAAKVEHDSTVRYEVVGVEPSDVV
jgi:AraC-like DNA-binding protein